MMSCDEARDLFPDYGDLPEGDPDRARVDEHVRHCPVCAEELNVWTESARLIQSAALEEKSGWPESGTVSVSVMNRIYAEEGWRLPVAERLYAIPHRIRMRLLTLIAVCLATFGCAFLYNLLSPEGSNDFMPSSGVIHVVALGSNETSGLSFQGIEGMPVASIGDPIVLGLPLVDSYPDYFLVLSMLGLIAALLIMNWFARIRA